MKKLFVLFGIIAAIFFAGVLAAHSTQINLSAGPDAEGQLAIAQAQAQQINAKSDADRAAADAALAEAQKYADATRAAKVARVNAWEKALLYGGVFFIFWVCLFGAIILMGRFSGNSWRALIVPLDKPVGDYSNVTIPFPLFPFFAIQTWRDAPTASTVYVPWKNPVHTSNRNLPILALARMLGADTQGEQRSGTGNIVVRNLGLLLQNIRQLRLPESVDHDDQDDKQE